MYFVILLCVCVCVCVCVFCVLVHLGIFLVRFGVFKASVWRIALYGSCLWKTGGRGGGGGQRRE